MRNRLYIVVLSYWQDISFFSPWFCRYKNLFGLGFALVFYREKVIPLSQRSMLNTA